MDTGHVHQLLWFKVVRLTCFIICRK